MRALITAGGGQLASDLQELLGDDARSFSHAELDIADSAALREVAHGAHVDRPRLVGLRLADVDVVERGAVEDDVRAGLLEGSVERRRVRDVELGVAVGARVVAQLRLQVGGELAAAPGDQRPHRTVANRSSDGLSSFISSSQRML